MHRMTAEGENALRYMAGNVALKLRRKFEKESTSKAVQLVECLSNMAIEGDESSYYAYTVEWIKLVNRGGLFCISDDAYHFFYSLEIATTKYLSKHISDACSLKDDLVQSITDSSDVQHFWCMLAIDIEEENNATELLHRVTELWITIRGFSMTATWMEEYKKAMKVVAKTKSLQKNLKLALRTNVH